ncbi:methyltransferase domain-containing protein [uncultured Desulfobacter sp.]|uniref:class I SAM-dependent methyltransferase n=1 Tax=uncultured Desulfobacter sp. TaxID=240139 RepID=UPI0029F4607C|nr:methyltransferase domain-containing protein [uncultured Desulfobacter sp.]
MKNSNNPALEPLGQALLAYWRGKKSAELIHEFKNGQKRSLPVSVFFRSHEEFLTTDKAIEYCRGRILVVGAGTGVHALELEKQGYEVTAIDICPQAVQIMTERGIKDAGQQDFFRFDSERFDTIFMLGHNIGICETLKGIKGLLHRCEKLIRPGGQLLVNSVKEPEVANSPSPKGYPGELEFRLSYEKNVGPWMRWLHVDFSTLTSHALKYGWSAEKLIETEEGGFLARMRPNL